MSGAITKDPTMKLFGTTIQLPDSPPPAILHSLRSTPPESSSAVTGADSSTEETHCDIAAEDEESQKDHCEGEPDDGNDENKHLTAEELQDQNPNLVKSSDNKKEPPAYTDCSTAKTSQNEEEQGETSNSQEKILKKPDKILPCPRCNSMETKFCYFNNYNVNQPRYFCKNCQRYWTAGGTMRNVPVGAGRRKNKNSAFHYHHISVPETLPNTRTDLPNGTQQPHLKLDGTILTFGTDKPLCESMTSVLNIADKTMQNCSGNGFRKSEDLGIRVAHKGGDNGDDHSNGSSVTAVSSKDSVNKDGLPDVLQQNINSFPSHLPCFTGAPWPYPWKYIHWSNAVAPPGYYLQGFPMPFYPATTYWGCTVPGSWNNTWISPTASQNQMPPTSGPNSPTLGKHSRDEDVLKSTSSEEEPRKESNPGKCLWTPKTSRIDDPGEAAMSSIWATLGIKHDKLDSVSGGLFKVFEPRSNERKNISENCTVLQANPAALSRSLNFNESS